MKKRLLTMALVLSLLLLGLTLPASAVPTISDSSSELHLFQIMNAFTDPAFTVPIPGGYTFTLGLGLISSQQAANTISILETLPTTGIEGGNPVNYTYKVTGYYAAEAGFGQSPGWYPKGNNGLPLPTPVFFTDVPGIGINSGFAGPLNVAFTPSGEFGFYDKTSDANAGTKFTERILNPSYGSQSNGLIFDLGNGIQYIVAFEDGSSTQPLGDSDYNDLVFNITRSTQIVPIPGSALLLGTGFLGLLGLGWRRRNQA
jgi:hypothetical protein